MNKFVVAALFIICSLTQSFSQKDLSSYSFVVVPDKYDFQFEKDQYQLNSLTKFLFNKHGFHAFFNNELPNVERCDGLWADIVRESGFIWTKMRVVIKDCNDEVIYTSEEGRSKLKEYGKAYQDGIRKAFESIIALGVRQKEMNVFDFSEETSEVKNQVTEAGEVKEDRVEEKVEEVKESLPAEVLDKTDIRSKDTFYENNGKVFILKEVAGGYKLYELIADSLTLKGLINQEADGLSFKDTSGNSFNCTFDDDRNLVISTSFQELIFKYQR
ncbi:MAG: hypothetical protein KTR22_04130 [Flavobacteriaceae bacterium]|nr:hypothetical protein [Flavobacteriaceae bacterium]